MLPINGGIFLLVCLCFVVLYVYVLCFMIKSELRKQPFYLQLICLGCHEIVSLVISCFNLVSSLISVWTVIPVQVFLVVGGAYAFLGSVNIWIMLEIAFVRFFSVFFPLHAQGFLAAKRLLGITMLAYFYAGAYVGLVNMTWPVYIPQHMVMFPARETETSFLGPSGTMLFQAVPIIGSVVCYLATAIKLFHLSILAKRKARRVGATSGAAATAGVNGSAEGVPNLQSATKRRAQWTMVKLAVILFSLYLSQILIQPIIIMSNGDFRFVCLHVFIQLTIAGCNPLIYMFLCQPIREIVPLPVCRSVSVNTTANVATAKKSLGATAARVRQGRGVSEMYKHFHETRM